MSNPPPLPPSWQPPALRPKKSGLPGWVITLIVFGAALPIIAILAAIAIPAFNATKRAKEVAEASKPLPPLTAEQKTAALAFGDKLVKALNAKNFAALEAMTDFETLARRSCQGMTFSKLAEQQFIAGIKKNRGGLMGQMVGNSAKLTRLTERMGYPALTVRLSPASGGVNFVDLVVRPDKDDFKVVDLYVYMFGVLSSRRWP